MAVPHPFEIQLAAIAHRLWCARMLVEGWTPGDRYDPVARTHDALVPFEQLNPKDRRNTTMGVLAEEVMQTLARVPEYVRAGDPELGPEDLRVGMRVAFTDDLSQHGTVLSWEADLHWPGCVNVIQVRWDSGDVEEYVAAERELRPLLHAKPDQRS